MTTKKNHGNRKRRETRNMSAVRDPRELRMLYVYTDIVEGHAYANKNLRVLRVIPYAPDAIYRGIHVCFEKLEFYGLAKKYFDSINLILNNREFEISFTKGSTEPVYAQLIFRKNK